MKTRGGPGVLVSSTLETLPLGRSRTLLKGTAPEGRRVAILGFGAMVPRLEKAARALQATLIDMRFVKPMDREAVLEAARTHDLVVTAEEGVRMGGAGSAVLEVLSQEMVCTPTLVLGIEDRFIEHGDTKTLLAECGLDEDGMLERIRKALERVTMQ